MGKGFFNRPAAFGLCMSIVIVFQVCVSVYIGATLSTLERRYRLTTSVASIILSTSDFASLLSITVITYFGHRSHRPRILGILGIIIGVGSIFSGLPHFLYPEYPDLEDQPVGNSSGSIEVCQPDRNPETCTADDIQQVGSRLNEAWMLLFGQALMGFAYGAITPLAVTYADEQVRGKTTPYFISAFLAAGTSAILVGFAEASVFLRIPIEWPSPDAEFSAYKTLGAWWMGFLLNGIILIFVSIPFFFFPKKMDIDYEDEPDDVKGLELDDMSKEKAVAKEEEVKASLELSFKGVSIMLKLLFTNIVFMACLCGTITELAIAAAATFFFSKYFELQYYLSPSTASLLVGLILMPSSLIGSVASGFIVKRLNLTGRGCGRFILINCCVALLIIPALYFLGCPEKTYSGVSQEKNNPLTSCNTNCTCTGETYLPVCGGDGITYATPCYAGCTGSNKTINPTTGRPTTEVYTGCGCVEGAADGTMTNTALPDVCPFVPPCVMLGVACAFMFLNVLIGSMSKNPLFMMQIRHVDPNHTTFALGLSALFSRALGFLPAPLYFGAMIQSTCILERTECGVTSNCFIYDTQKYRLAFLGLFFGLKICSFIFYVIATVRATKLQNVKDREKQQSLKAQEKAETNGYEKKGTDNKSYEPEYAESGAQTSF